MYFAGIGWIGSRGGSGGNGGYNSDTITVIPGNSYLITIGQGGLGGGAVLCGTGDSGMNGGASNFNSVIIAQGGTGGLGQNSLLGNGNQNAVSGINGLISNWPYPASNIVSSYIPSGLLTEIPSLASGGLFGERGQTFPVALSPASGANGQDGYCIISY
jgi:hypothetical protein